MSTPAPRLELMPPTPPDPPQVPAQASDADRRAAVARARRVMLRLGLGACCVIPTAVLLAPIFGQAGMVVALLIVGALVIPVCGIGLIVSLAIERSRESVQSLLAAVLSLVAAVALVEPAQSAAIELHVAAHQAELDALAVEVRAAAAQEPIAPGPTTSLDQRLTERFRPRLRDVGIDNVAVVDGGLLFLSAEGPYTLLYADGGAGPALPCPNASLRALGGRWFQQRCRGATAQYED